MPSTTIVRTNDPEPDDGVGRDTDGSGMTAMRTLAFFPERQSSLAVEDAIAFWIGG
jgi:hypothetical protein